MHDPMTVAFEFRPLGLTIWHKDPERRGDDDSCDWFGRQSRKLNEREQAVVEAMWDLETLLDNAPHFPDSPEHKRFQALKAAVRKAHAKTGWRIPPRWHVWHWRIQIGFLLDLKRWLFSRCVRCGKRFPWGYCPCSGWSGPGPRWFRNEHAWHADCERPASDGAACVQETR
jgi:hypothetical protein